MKKNILIFTVLIFLVCVINTSFASENKKKLAQTGFQFLSVISDAEAAAMAGAVNSLEMGSRSLFFNPAGLAGMNYRTEVTASFNEWIADINHMTFSAAINLTPRTGSLGIFGITVQSIDYGEILETMVANNEKGYEDIGVFSPTAYSVGLGYARMLSDRFSVGGQVKLVHQDMGESFVPISGDSVSEKRSYDLSPISYDFGTLFKTGFKSLTFGMSVRHFSKEIKYVEEGFQLPLLFTLGVSMNVLDFIEVSEKNHSLIVSLDATHDRSYPEQLLVGFNYTLMNTLSLRTGYITGDDEEGFSFGFGVSKFGLELNYGYTPFGVFDNIQRMTAIFKF